MSVRKAEYRDIPKIMDLLDQVLRVHAELRPDLFEENRTKYSPEEVRTVLDQPETPVFVYEDTEYGVLGYIFCRILPMPKRPHLKPLRTLFIDDFCVDEEFRGRKIGKQLYAYVREYAKTLGFDRITLNVWNANRAAYEFYETAGLSPLETVMEDCL